ESFLCNRRPAHLARSGGYGGVLARRHRYGRTESARHARPVWLLPESDIPRSSGRVGELFPDAARLPYVDSFASRSDAAARTNKAGRGVPSALSSSQIRRILRGCR